ncbi:MAG: hypothetical protein P1U61_09090 [Legionellaceae bacterium]|nr:hypothetical protein [Legionellaceae bacterium]
MAHGSITGPKMADMQFKTKPDNADELAIVIKLDSKTVFGKKNNIYRVSQYRHGALVIKNDAILKSLKMLEIKAELVALRALTAFDARTAIEMAGELDELKKEEERKSKMQTTEFSLLEDSDDTLSVKIKTAEDALELLVSLEALEARTAREVRKELGLLKAHVRKEAYDAQVSFVDEKNIKVLEEELLILEAFESLGAPKKIQLDTRVLESVKTVLASQRGVSVASISREDLIPFENDILFLQELICIAAAVNVDPSEIMLCLDGNLGCLGDESLTELFFMCVEALKPTRLVAFSNTPDCVTAGDAYCSAHTKHFIGKSVASTQIKQTVAEICSDEICMSSGQSVSDVTTEALSSLSSAKSRFQKEEGAEGQSEKVNDPKKSRRTFGLFTCCCSQSAASIADVVEQFPPIPVQVNVPDVPEEISSIRGGSLMRDRSITG